MFKKSSTASSIAIVKGRGTTARAKAKKSRNLRFVLLIGDSKCGKTSFMNRVLFDTFSDNYEPTLEDCHEKRYEHNGYVFHLELIDTGGPFEFPAMRDLNIRRAHVAMVMYDVTRSKSMETVALILSMIDDVRGKDNPLHCLIVGNKLDLHQGNDLNDVYSTLDNYINFYSDWITNHCFCSCKNNVNVRKTMEMVLDHLLLTTPEDSLIEIPSLEESRRRSSYMPRYIFCCGRKCCKKYNL